MTREQAVEIFRANLTTLDHQAAMNWIRTFEDLGLLQLSPGSDPAYTLARTSVEVEYAPYAGGSVQRFLTKEGAQQVVDILRMSGFKITKE